MPKLKIQMCYKTNFKKNKTKLISYLIHGHEQNDWSFPNSSPSLIVWGRSLFNVSGSKSERIPPNTAAAPSTIRGIFGLLWP